MNLFDPNVLLASLLWSSIGVGYFVYGKRQQSMVPLIGGLLIIVASYFTGSALVMSVVCIALIAGIHLLLRQGY